MRLEISLAPWMRWLCRRGVLGAAAAAVALRVLPSRYWAEVRAVAEAPLVHTGV